MNTLRFTCAAALIAAALSPLNPSWAQTPAPQGEGPLAADHEALRQLKTDLAAVVEKRDFDAAAKLLHDPFMITVITQDAFTSLGPLKAFYDSLFSRDLLRLKSMSVAPEADELSQIHTGTFALTRGSTAEHYELSDGRAYDMKGRWTAVSMKGEDGRWKLMALHTGTNFLDNPVLEAIERRTLGLVGGGVAVGAVIGFALAWFLRRRRPAS